MTSRDEELRLIAEAVAAGRVRRIPMGACSDGAYIGRLFGRSAHSAAVIRKTISTKAAGKAKKA